MKILYLFLAILLMMGACRKSNAVSDNNNNNNNNNNNTVIIQDTLNSWVKIPIEVPSAEDIWFTTPNKGILVDGGSAIYLSSDSGKSWNYTFSTNQHINAFNLQFVDSLNGFAQGNGLMATSDGGKSWTVRNSAMSGIYFQFVNPSTGYYFDSNNGIFITHDGGSSWALSLPVTPTTETLKPRYPFYFRDSLSGYSMMDGNFYTTTNGGMNWTIQSTVTGVDFMGYLKMQFLDTQTGYCGINGGLLKTTNGGKSWIKCFGGPSAVNGTFSIPHFFDDDNGYFMTDNGIYKTTNGGQSWTTSCRIATGSTFYSVYFLDMNTGWACTYNSAGSGYILRLK